MKVSSVARTLSFVGNLALVLYLTLLMVVIRYGLETGASFGIGRIAPDEGRDLLQAVVQLDGKGEDVYHRLAMAFLINLRINQAAWYAIWFTSLYGLFGLSYSQRTTIHLLGCLAIANTVLVHLYHLGWFSPYFFEQDSLVPANDPYHQIPLPGDCTVATLNLAALIAVVWSNATLKETTTTKKMD